MAQEESAAPQAGVGESAPEVPAQRAPEPLGQQALFELPAQPSPASSAEDSEESDESKNSDEVPAQPTLAPRERAVLDFELRRWKHSGSKDQAIREQFELSPTQYFQILNTLLDNPAALAYNPTLVARLRRLREARQQARH